MHSRITPAVITEIVDAVPQEWLIEEGREMSADEARQVYRDFLTRRLEASETFVKQAVDARKSRI